MTVADPSPAPAGSGDEVDALALRRAARGDQTAARAFFDHYHRLVHAYLWRMLTPYATRPLVEDLVQDTFLRAFAALPRFVPDGEARVSTWLLTIATRVALNELRRKQRKPDATVDVDLVALPGGKRPDDAAHARAVGRLVARAVGELPDAYRAVFVLREYHDRTLDEIAAALEVPVGTVQSRLSRARAALREALQGVQP
ncbi:MAG TPA: RNA polymerase sigma factor [Kofleriaceae bacterium]|nr:RNA polymerase sigma factor [Kofleriaceae bacterium]